MARMSLCSCSSPTQPSLCLIFLKQKSWSCYYCTQISVCFPWLKPWPLNWHLWRLNPFLLSEPSLVASLVQFPPVAQTGNPQSFQKQNLLGILLVLFLSEKSYLAQEKPHCLHWAFTDVLPLSTYLGDKMQKIHPRFVCFCVRQFE